jgi:hypothetical protein
LSVCAHIKRARRSGAAPITVEFDLIDGLAFVNGRMETPEGILRAQVLQDDVERLKSGRDKRWPKPARRDPDWCDAGAEITRLSSKVARVRRDALHVWTTRIISQASSLTIKIPDIRKHTKTPHGNEKNWGAAVDDVSAINRTVLSYSAASARAMLEYKAAEAGIRCEVVSDPAAAIAVGAKIVHAAKTIRRASRKQRKAKDAEQ